MINTQSPVALKEFYDEVKDCLTGTLNVKIQKLNEIKEEMDDYKKKQKELVIDGCLLKSHKSLFHKGRFWNNDLCEKISDEKINVAVAWMKNTPVVIDFIREKEETDRKSRFLDCIVKSQFEYLVSQGNYDIAYDLMKDYTVGSDEKLAIRLKTCSMKEDMEFIENTVIFVEDAVYITNKKMNEEIAHISKGNKTDFENFGNENYGDNFITIRNQELKELLEKYPQLIDEIFEEVAKKADEARLKKKEKEDIQQTMELIEAFDISDDKEEEVVLLSFDELCENAVAKCQGQWVEENKKLEYNGGR